MWEEIPLGASLPIHDNGHGQEDGHADQEAEDRR